MDRSFSSWLKANIYEIKVLVGIIACVAMVVLVIKVVGLMNYYCSDLPSVVSGVEELDYIPASDLTIINSRRYGSRTGEVLVSAFAKKRPGIYYRGEVCGAMEKRAEKLTRMIQEQHSQFSVDDWEGKILQLRFLLIDTEPLYRWEYSRLRYPETGIRGSEERNPNADKELVKKLVSERGLDFEKALNNKVCILFSHTNLNQFVENLPELLSRVQNGEWTVSEKIERRIKSSVVNPLKSRRNKWYDLYNLELDTGRENEPQRVAILLQLERLAQQDNEISAVGTAFNDLYKITGKSKYRQYAREIGHRIQDPEFYRWYVNAIW